jgi:hypothetical protein
VLFWRELQEHATSTRLGGLDRVLNTRTFCIPFLFWPQGTFLPSSTYFSASHTVMACSDYGRLERQYEAAVRLWTELLSDPETVIQQNSSQLKLEALTKLTKVVDLLYFHRRWCSDCKRADVELIDLSD